MSRRIVVSIVIVVATSGCRRECPSIGAPAHPTAAPELGLRVAREHLLGDDDRARDAALAAFAAACRRDDPSSCDVVITNEKYRPERKAAAELIELAACRAGDVRGCRMLDGPVVVAADRSAVEAACKEGIAAACRFLVDEPSLPQLQDFCLRGDLEACDRAASSASAPDDLRRQMAAKAEALSVATCRAGFAGDCPASGRRTYLAASRCERLDSDACQIYFGDPSTVADSEIAAIACHLRPVACLGAATHVRDEMLARALLDYGCMHADEPSVCAAAEAAVADPAAKARLHAKRCEIAKRAKIPCEGAP